MVRARLIAALAGTLALPGVAAAGAPTLVAGETHLDFGQVVYGTKVTHAFAVVNGGDAPLRIEKVSAACDCFRATFDEEIGPSGEGRIRIELDTTDLRGPVLLTARVESNDPERSLVRLELRGFVKGPIAFVPKSHLAMKTIRGEARREDLYLEIHRPEALKVTRVETTDAVFEADHDTIRRGRKYRIRVKVRKDAPIGIHRGKVHVFGEGEEAPVASADVSVLVLGSIVADPSMLNLSRVMPKQAREGIARESWKVELRSLRGRPFDIVQLEPQAPFLHARHESSPDRLSHRIYVGLEPNSDVALGTTQVELWVRTTLPEESELRILVLVNVAEPR